MATTTFNVRMDEELKARLDQTASSIGLTTAAVFNVFARQFVARGGFPFDVVAPTPTEAVFAAQMDERYEQMSQGHAHAHDLLEDE